ncbi:MAG: hypothetical protein AB7J28_08075 [Hyphomonadaceae bacterium]
MVKRVAASLAALLFVIGCAHAQQAQPTRPAPPTCDTPNHRAFDFWIGEWDAYVTGTENMAGRSTIAREDAGCVITEHWRSQRVTYSGRSLNMYDRITGRWEQFWVDSTGNITHFIGGAHEGGMRLVAEDDVGPGQATPVFNRMTFTPNPDGSVRQHGEQSSDRGATWTTSYDFTYRPHRE